MADLTEHEAVMRTATVGSIEFAPDQRGQFAVVPDGFKVSGLEDFQHVPNRHRADHRFVDVASLAEYLNRFATADTMICADYGAAKISCVLDGDAPDAPAHKSHKARFEAQQSDQIKAWLGISGKPLAQTTFGLFLEERAVDVAVPDAADVMDMVMTFDATKKVIFKSSQRLHDGSRQFTYTEDNDTRGAVKLPDHFIILAPVYRGMEPERVKFMVRYRIEEGSLRFVVEMHDRDAVMRAAFDRCVDALRADLKQELPVYVTG